MDSRRPGDGVLAPRRGVPHGNRRRGLDEQVRDERHQEDAGQDPGGGPDAPYQPHQPPPLVGSAASRPGGRWMLSLRNTVATLARRIRPTSNCLPGSVLATSLIRNSSTSMLCTPMTAGGSSSRRRRSGSLYASSPISRRVSLTWLTSMAAGTGTSMTARAQSLDRFVTCVIWPLGVMTSSPSTVRTEVTRSVTSSTVPTDGSGLFGADNRMRSP